MDDYLTKPVVRQTLLDTLRKWLPGKLPEAILGDPAPAAGAPAAPPVTSARGPAVPAGTLPGPAATSPPSGLPAPPAAPIPPASLQGSALPSASPQGSALPSASPQGSDLPPASLQGSALPSAPHLAPALPLASVPAAALPGTHPPAAPEPAADQPPAEGPGLDPARFSEMSGLFGDAFKEAVLGPFLTALHAQRDDIIAGLAEGGDPDAARRQAHTIKGAAGNLGFLALSTLGARVEKAVKEGDLPRAIKDCSALEAEVTRVEAMIEGMA